LERFYDIPAREIGAYPISTRCAENTKLKLISLFRLSTVSVVNNNKE
jgi:hypothetical protein